MPGLVVGAREPVVVGRCAVVAVVEQLDALTVYGATVAPLVFWHANLPRKFHWFLDGDFVAGLLPREAGVAALGLFDLCEAGCVDVERVDVDEDLVVVDGQRVVELARGLGKRPLGGDDAMTTEAVAATSPSPVAR